MSEKTMIKELKEDELEQVTGGDTLKKEWWQELGYSSIFENLIACPNPNCGSTNTIWYYRNNPRRCVKIECKNCNYLVEDENGI